VDSQLIQKGLADISAEQDPTLKNLKLASLCSALWRERGVELVVVGGSAMQELMGLLGAKGGPRNWQVAGMFLDLLGPAESFARTLYRKVEAPYGPVIVMKAEDLLAERVLISVYPQPDQTARDCSRALIAVALRNQVAMNWSEVRRVAQLPEYRNLKDCEDLVQQVADELKLENPMHSPG
jgi:hypothetical protein